MPETFGDFGVKIRICLFNLLMLFFSGNLFVVHFLWIEKAACFFPTESGIKEMSFDFLVSRPFIWVMKFQF